MVACFLIGFAGAYGYFASDYGYLVAMAIAWGQIDTIGVACEDLTEYLDTYGNKDIHKINDLVTDIVKILQHHSQYMTHLDHVYGFHSAVIVITAMISQTITLFSIIKAGWIFGILFAFVFIFQILTICLVGGVYVVKLSKLQETVNQTNWYLMPWRKQKMFISIIHNIQNIPEPTAMSLIPLNFNTFVNCMKTMYQLLMLLFNVSK
ncbi:Odorant receptor [Sergentomyia squamirostris]